MLKLTTQHIEQIRSYFLATTNEEKNALQKNITPYFLSGFLNDLKRLFIYQPLDEANFGSIAKNMGAEEHLDSLKEIQQDFYDYLASLFANGVSNEDIEQLLKVNNPVFNEATEFHANLIRVFRINEREGLKKKFKAFDALEEISDTELTNAIKQLEREKLKTTFQDIEQWENFYRNTVNYSLSPIRKKISKRSKLKPLAIAASIVGLLTLAGYLFFPKDGKQEHDQISKNKEKEITLFGNENKLVNYSSVYEVKEQRALGSNNKKKVDSITVIVRDVVSMSDLITFKKSFLSDSLKGNEPGSKNNRHVLDSLSSLEEYLRLINNTYSYDPEKKIITLNAPFTDSVIAVYRYPTTGKQSSVYVQFNNSFYKIDPGIAPIPIKPVNDRNLIEILRKIFFNTVIFNKL